MFNLPSKGVDGFLKCILSFNIESRYFIIYHQPSTGHRDRGVNGFPNRINTNAFALRNRRSVRFTEKKLHRFPSRTVRIGEIISISVRREIEWAGCESTVKMSKRRYYRRGFRRVSLYRHIVISEQWERAKITRLESDAFAPQLQSATFLYQFLLLADVAFRTFNPTTSSLADFKSSREAERRIKSSSRFKMWELLGHRHEVVPRCVGFFLIPTRICSKTLVKDHECRKLDLCWCFCFRVIGCCIFSISLDSSTFENLLLLTGASEVAISGFRICNLHKITRF